MLLSLINPPVIIVVVIVVIIVIVLAVNGTFANNGGNNNKRSIDLSTLPIVPFLPPSAAFNNHEIPV